MRTQHFFESSTSLTGIGFLSSMSLLILMFFGFPLFSFIIMKSAGIYQCTPTSGATEVCVFGYARYIAHEWLSIGSTALSFGALGVSISAIARLNSPELVGYQLNFPVLLLLHLLGGSFGLILLMLFIGGLVQGSLFPKFEDGTMWSKLTFHLTDWAKLIVWCFLAGFSERLVPRLLENLISKSNDREAEAA